MSSQAGNAPTTTGAPGGAVATTERQEYERKVLQSVIEAAAVYDQSLSQRLTVAAVWQFFRLPDSAFGWSASGGMPTEAKALCIVNTLALGLVPGVGHVLWLGNKCYVTAPGVRTIANGSADFKLVGKRTLRPFNDDERLMFGIGDRDLTVVLEQRISIKGVELECAGYGILGADEIGKGKPGTGTVKDRAMSVYTRAERDLYNRYFTLKNVDIMPDSPEDVLHVERNVTPGTTALEAPIGLASPPPPATAIMAAEEAFAAGRLRNEATQRVAGLAARVAAAGGRSKDVLGVTLAAPWFNETPVDQMHDAGDALEAWLAEHETQPDPTPPGASAPQPSPTAAEPAAPAKKRGRPRKDATAAAPASESMSEKSTPAAPVVPMAHAGAPQAGDLVAMSPDVVDEAGDPDWEGEEPTVERAQMRELTDETFAMAEGGEFEADLSDAGDAFEPAPAPAPAPSGPITAARDRAASAERLRKAMDAVLQRGGAPMSVLGYNPHNRLGDPRASAYELEEMARILEAWSPDKRSPVEKNNAAREAQGGPAPVQRPAAPSSFDRVPAHDMIERALGMSDNTPEIRAKLEELGRGPLDSSDHLRLPKAIREAKNGNCRGLDELLAAARKAR